MASTQGYRDFLAARDLLVELADDYDAARERFSWPQLDEWNFALDWFDRVAENNDAPALWIVEEDGSESKFSYAEMSARSNRVANWLRERGVHPGDRILLMLSNQVELWDVMLAAIKLGAVVIPATTLLAEDPVEQSALATFVGSFVFSIVGLVALRISAYGPQGRVLLFLTTLAVIVLIVLALLRWIDQLSKLGRVADTTARLEEAAREAMQTRLDAPCLGGQPLQAVPGPDRGGQPVTAGQVGYVQHIDPGALAMICEAEGWRLDILVLPGSFVYADTPLALVHAGAAQDASLSEAMIALIRAAFTLGQLRSFDQDPRFGLVTLSEVALRALSPAVNDPGTAIDVIGRQTRLLTYWAQGHDDSAKAGKVAYPRVSVPVLRFGDLYEDAFNLIGRDGAGQIDVMLRLVKALQALTRIGPPEARHVAARQLAIARDRAMQNLPMDDEKARLAAALS